MILLRIMEIDIREYSFILRQNNYVEILFFIFIIYG